jgi:hypothetical protein
MTDVACFCGCCYSFSGAAGPCPVCGEIAVVSAHPRTGHGWPRLAAGRTFCPQRWAAGNRGFRLVYPHTPL